MNSDPTGIHAFRESVRDIVGRQTRFAGVDSQPSPSKNWWVLGILAVTAAIFIGTLNVNPGSTSQHV
jgi:hypothetical protein